MEKRRQIHAFRNWCFIFQGIDTFLFSVTCTLDWPSWPSASSVNCCFRVHCVLSYTVIFHSRLASAIFSYYFWHFPSFSACYEQEMPAHPVLGPSSHHTYFSCLPGKQYCNFVFKLIFPVLANEMFVTKNLTSQACKTNIFVEKPQRYGCVKSSAETPWKLASEFLFIGKTLSEFLYSTFFI